MASPFPLRAYFSGAVAPPAPRLAVSILTALPLDDPIAWAALEGARTPSEAPAALARRLGAAEPSAFAGFGLDLPGGATVFLDRASDDVVEFARSGPDSLQPFEEADREKTARRLEALLMALVTGTGAVAAISAGFREDYVTGPIDAFEAAMETWEPADPLPLRRLLAGAAHLCAWRAGLAADVEPTRRRGDVLLAENPHLSVVGSHRGARVGLGDVRA